MIEQNKYDVYNWVLKVIKSSTTLQQVRSGRRLVHNFDTIYSDNDLERSLWDCASTQREIIIRNRK